MVPLKMVVPCSVLVPCGEGTKEDGDSWARVLRTVGGIGCLNTIDCSWKKKKTVVVR